MKKTVPASHAGLNMPTSQVGAGHVSKGTDHLNSLKSRLQVLKDKVKTMKKKFKKK